jgi:hypothetical protein
MKTSLKVLILIAILAVGALAVETTLQSLPANTYSAPVTTFTQAHADSINAVVTAQNANNTSLRASINLLPTIPVVSASLDPTTIQYATVALTNTQTKACFSAPTQVIAAPGANKLIEVTSVLLENVFLTAAYANGGVIQLSYGAGVTTPASSTVAATFLTSPVATQVIVLPGALATNLASTVTNTAVNFACATADFITGAGNVTVKVAYRVHSGL